MPVEFQRPEQNTPETFDIAVCVDCLMLIANGETPPDMTRAGTNKWLAGIDQIWHGYHVAAGMTAEKHSETGCDCRQSGEKDCSAEESYFSWAPCDYCRRPLGGDRHPATAWKFQS